MLSRESMIPDYALYPPMASSFSELFMCLYYDCSALIRHEQVVMACRHGMAIIGVKVCVAVFISVSNLRQFGQFISLYSNFMISPDSLILMMVAAYCARRLIPRNFESRSYVIDYIGFFSALRHNRG